MKYGYARVSTAQQKKDGNSLEDRRRTVQIASELSIRLTAKVTGISRSTVQRWVDDNIKANSAN